MNPRALFKQAAAALVRGGQRSFVAVLAVAFGVATLTAMLLLTVAIRDAVTVPPRLALGGDVVVEGALTDTLRTRLEALKAQGAVQAWTPDVTLDLLLAQSQHAGRMSFVARVRGVDPSAYPLYGAVALRSGQPLAEALASPDAVVVTQDVAWQLGLSPGDTLQLTGEGGLRSLSRVVTGIATSTPDFFGSSAFLRLDTVDPSFVKTASVPVRGDDPEAVAAALNGDGFRAAAVEEEKPLDDNMRRFIWMLRGAGLLGLFVGGIGVANTISVLLAGRTAEIAVRKTMGYPAGALYVLFGAEALMLGVAGGLAGAAAGYALAAALMRVLSRSLPLLTSVSADPAVLTLGVAMGVATALLFSILPIARATSVRPTALLRDLPLQRTAGQHAGRLGLVAVLAVFFWLLCAFVMGSLVAGAVVVGVVASGFVVFGGVLVGLLFLFSRVPLPGVPLARFARRNVMQKPGQTAFTLIALFAGFFAIGLAVVVLHNATHKRAGRAPDRTGYNLSVVTPPADTAAVFAVLRGARADAIRTRLLAPATYFWDDGDEQPIMVEAEALPPGMAQRRPRFASREDTARVRVGDQAKTYVLTTTFETEAPGLVSFISQPDPQLRLPRADVDALATRRVGITAQVPPEALKGTAAALAREAPQRAVLTVDEVGAFFDLLFLALFQFAVSVASLALVGGIVLIANGVTLALVERRREVGVLKSMGYHRGHVLRMLAYEYGGMGALAVGVSLGAVAVMVELIAWQTKSPLLNLGAARTLALVAAGIALPVATVYLTGWRAAARRPLDTLRSQ